ncbi:Malonyl-[acyl-carrier protein] O-methyltransferase [Symmachiella dynata]|uniref:class I SAM-dependent methyltransferase n=1 Tax=Symmachiella dynata TaxID=2527995 RepID=UPI00118B7D9B|nr:class I SAM-dependent methyltransferase [Symmachiella dynata]QDT48365.1 Malonyl-[acyl-carrier protein] O-methyltransferase [Symmachiella dynata]
MPTSESTKQAGVELGVDWEQTSCPLCGADQPHLMLTGPDRLLGLPGTFRLVQCGACGHAYLNPRPTQETIGAYYPAEYAPYHAPDDDAAKPQTTATQRVGPLRRCLRWFLDPQGEFIPPLTQTPRRALEIGCADGGFLERLKTQGWEVSGVEFSPDAVATAQQRGLDVQLGTLESANLPANHFDAVFLWMVLEHLHDPQATLREIHRILKPDGWLMFSVPNFGAWDRRFFGRYWYALDLPRHLQHFTPRTVKRLLSETGFETDRIIYQRTANNLVGSLGYWWRDRFPNSRLAATLIRHCDAPRTGLVLLLAIPAKVWAWLRQGGGLTVVARPKTDSLISGDSAE